VVNNYAHSKTSKCESTDLALLAHLSCHAGRRGVRQSFAAALEGLVGTRATKRKREKEETLAGRSLNTPPGRETTEP
jgi:hypothetical protein